MEPADRSTPAKSHGRRINPKQINVSLLSQRNHGTPLPLQPRKKKITHITRNRKNINFAIPADAAAIPPNPNTAAISAMIRKVTAQPNISFTSFAG
jgi:hypothetical protein